MSLNNKFAYSNELYDNNRLSRVYQNKKSDLTKIKENFDDVNN